MLAAKRSKGFLEVGRKVLSRLLAVGLVSRVRFTSPGQHGVSKLAAALLRRKAEGRGWKKLRAVKILTSAHDSSCAE